MLDGTRGRQSVSRDDLFIGRIGATGTFARAPHRVRSGSRGRCQDDRVRHDLVLSAFGATVPEVVEAAVTAEAAGFDGVWVFDHFSGAMLGRPWSLDPFVLLGAIAARTERVTLGPLVANVANRHPAQLASALGALQTAAPGRVWCGLGSGATPGSRFAGEMELIGRPIADADTRRAQVVETIACLRAIWGGVPFEGRHYRVGAVAGIVPAGTELPPIVVGASGPATVALAVASAHGVNIRDGARLAELVARARGAAGPGFEISVFTAFEPEVPLGGDVERLATLGVDRRTLFASAPFDLHAIRSVGAQLART